MAIRKILNGKLVEMRPIPTGDKKDVCKTCALANEKVQCTTRDDTCMEYPDDNWHLVLEDVSRIVEQGVSYVPVLRNELTTTCAGCAAEKDKDLCPALKKLGLCEDRYFIKDENAQENNQ